MTDNGRSKEVLRALSDIAKESSLSINELRVILALERICGESRNSYNSFSLQF